MKKLFAIILSLGLIMAPVPNINTAHAGGTGGYAKILLGMSNGVVGSTILLKCAMGSMQPSIIAYMAGSLVYVAAEIIGGKEKSKSVGMNAEQLDQLKATMKEGGDYQRGALEAQLKNEEDNLKHAQKKMTWMRATQIVYTIAAVLALIEWWMSLPTPAGMNKPDAGACSMAADGVDLPNIKLIVLAYSALQGYATNGMMGAGMSVAIGLALPMFEMGLTLITFVQNKLVTMLNSALGRVAFFGAAAIVVTVLVAELQKEIDKIKDRIAKIRSILGTMNGASNNLAEDSPDDAGDANDKVDPATGKKYAIKNLPKGQELAKTCFGSSGKTMTFSEGNCKNSFKLTKPKIEGKFEIPTISSGLNSSIDMANAMASGDSAAAEVEAGKLASMAGRINGIYNELTKKTNDELKKQGKKGIDVKAELSRQLAAVNDHLNKNGAGPSNMSLADFDTSKVGESAVSETKPIEEGEIKAASVDAAKAPEGSTTDLSKLDGASADGEGVLDPNADANKVASLTDGLNGFESNEGDISKERDVSIFKQVSNRYFLNYTKLFERKKVETPLAEPTP